MYFAIGLEMEEAANAEEEAHKLFLQVQEDLLNEMKSAPTYEKVIRRVHVKKGYEDKPYGRLRRSQNLR